MADVSKIKLKPDNITLNIKDATARTNINNEIAARQQADNTLQTNINNEATARTNADNALRELITNNQNYVNVLSYGAVGDGTTDNADAINNAIEEIAQHDGGGKLYFPTGHYLINDTIKVKSNVSLIGDGDSSILDFKNLQTVPNREDKIAIWCNGEVDVPIPCNSTTLNEDTVIVSDASNFNVGDLVEIYSATQRYDYKSTGDGAYYGELGVVISKTGNTIQIDHPHYVSITTDAYIRKINPAKGITIENLQILGDNAANYWEHGLYLTFCKDAIINHVTIKGFDWYSIGIVSSYNVIVDGNTIMGVEYDGQTGQIFYNIAVLNDSCFVNVINNFASRGRHLFVCTSYTNYLGYKGSPAYINVANNIAIGMEFGGLGVSYAYEHHGHGYAINIHDNIANACYAGCNIEGSNCNVYNNLFTDCECAGIIMGDARIISYINIKNNIIREPIGHSYITGSKGGIVFDSNNVVSGTKIAIEGNTIYYNSNPAIQMGSFPASDCIIADNELISTNYGALLVYAAVLNASVGNLINIFKGNKILNTARGVLVMLGRWIISDNVINGTRVNPNNNAFGVAQGNHAIKLLHNSADYFKYFLTGTNSPTIQTVAFNEFLGEGTGSFKSGITVTNENYNLSY